MMRSFLLVAASLASLRAAEAAVARPPNVVIVFTDDQGYGDLSCYGHPTIHTPHIDRLAAEGVKLTQFYVASPVCSPSRAALLTGCYPKRVGMHEHVIFPPYDFGLHTDEVTIADVLDAEGYATACFGKWHLGHRDGLLPTDQGFDAYFGVPYSNDMSRFHRPPHATYPHRLPLMRDKEIVEWEPDQRYLTKRCTEDAVKFIDEHHDEPFFVYVPHSMPHIPIYASEAFAGRSPHGLYGDVIEEIDWSVGEIRAAIDRHGLAEDTIIMFATDNGPWLPFKHHGGTAGLLRGGKGSNWEGGQRVPCVLWWPGRIPAASVCREVATAMDVLPTIAAQVGATLPADRPVDGHDISDLILGTPDARSPTDAFLYYTSHGELAGIRRGKWKLLLENDQLFDVEVDVSEKRNAAKQHPELVAELRALAESRDAEITDAARPVRTVDEPLWPVEQAADWQWGQWRGPLASGVAPHANPPLEWSETENVRWKVGLPGLGHSTPAVWGDHVILTAARPYGEAFEPEPDTAPGAHDNAPVTHHHEFLVFALSRRDGSVKWQHAVHRERPHEGGHVSGSLASASPCTDGRHVFAFFGSRGLYCFDMKGQEVWRADLGEMLTKHAHGEGSSPVLHGDTLVVNWDHEGRSFVVAFDKATGEERWRVDREELTSWSSPIVVEHEGRAQLIVSATRRVRGYDLATGDVIWECGGLSSNVVASPVHGDGIVYAGSSYEKQAMLAVRLDGATGDVANADNLLWYRRRRTPYVPSPLLYDGVLYFMHHYQTFMSRVIGSTGEEPHGPFRLQGLGNVYASPVGAAGRVYVTDRDGATLVLSHEDVPQPMALNRLDDSFSASAALVGDEIFLRGEAFLYCIGETGSGSGTERSR